ncbi:DUF6153 family protein [Solicola gregarius]|uniref:DUF6153 family protein n=1 Tax=Solicola gregarius TaxID=2908642 RepID=UPI0038CD8B45
MTRLPHGGVVVLVCTLVLGILGMHALAQACGEASHSAATTTATAAADEATYAEHPDDRLMVHAGDDGTSPSEQHGLLALCLAVLVFAGTVWVIARSCRLGHGWAVPMRRVRNGAAPIISRPRPPPSLISLSILRC